MKRLLLGLFFASLIGPRALARGGSHDGLAFFSGLNRNLESLQTGNTRSQFVGGGYVLGVSFGLPFNGVTAYAEASYGKQVLQNTYQTATFLENSIETSIRGKLGVTLNKLTFGVGGEQIQESISTFQSASSTIQGTNRALRPLLFMQGDIDLSDQTTINVGLEYGSGTIGSYTSSSINLFFNLKVFLF